MLHLSIYYLSYCVFINTLVSHSSQSYTLQSIHWTSKTLLSWSKICARKLVHLNINVWFSLVFFTQWIKYTAELQNTNMNLYSCQWKIITARGYYELRLHIYWYLESCPNVQCTDILLYIATWLTGFYMGCSVLDFAGQVKLLNQSCAELNLQNWG